MSTKIPIQIVDKNGKQTTVHKKVDAAKTGRKLPTKAAPAVQDNRPVNELNMGEIADRLHTNQKQIDALEVKGDSISKNKENATKASVLRRENSILSSQLNILRHEEAIEELGYDWHTSPSTESVVGVEEGFSGNLVFSFTEWGTNGEEVFISESAEKNLLAYLNSEFPPDGEKRSTYTQEYPVNVADIESKQTQLSELRDQIDALRVPGDSISKNRENKAEASRLSREYTKLRSEVQRDELVATIAARDNAEYSSVDTDGFGTKFTLEIETHGDGYLFNASEWGDFRQEVVVSRDDAKALRDLLAKRQK